MHSDESATYQLIYRNCCRTCGEAKAPDEFKRDAHGATGRQASCRECVKRRAAAWQRENPERHRAHVGAWKARHVAELRRYEASGRGRQKEIDRAFARLVVRVASTTLQAIKTGLLSGLTGAAAALAPRSS